jgi:hypothetical protein
MCSFGFSSAGSLLLRIYLGHLNTALYHPASPSGNGVVAPPKQAQDAGYLDRVANHGAPSVQWVATPYTNRRLDPIKPEHLVLNASKTTRMMFLSGLHPILNLG